MRPEIEANKEKLHPNQILNGAINFYIAKAVENGLFKSKADPKIALGVIEHLANDPFAKYPSESLFKSKDFKNDNDLVLGLGKLAFEAYSNKKDIKEIARGKFDPRLIAYAPQALLVYSYLPLLENLVEIAHGKVEYGFGKKLNRLQPHNSLAAGEMMKNASKKIAEEVVHIAKQRGVEQNFAVLELGCGNASFSASVVEAFVSQGLKAPYILATDLDPNTQPTAKKLFTEKGIQSSLNLMKVDMGDRVDLSKAAQKLNDKTVLIHIGYILHENRVLATNTLSGLVDIFGNKDTVYAFSEYYLQEHIGAEVPLWFQTIHAFTQELFKRDELSQFIYEHGLINMGELTHNIRKDNGDIMNSTTFWENNRNYIFTPALKARVDLDLAF